MCLGPLRPCLSDPTPRKPCVPIRLPIPRAPAGFLQGLPWHSWPRGSQRCHVQTPSKSLHLDGGQALGTRLSVVLPSAFQPPPLQAMHPGLGTDWSPNGLTRWLCKRKLLTMLQLPGDLPSLGSQSRASPAPVCPFPGQPPGHRRGECDCHPAPSSPGPAGYGEHPCDITPAACGTRGPPSLSTARLTPRVTPQPCWHSAPSCPTAQREQGEARPGSSGL